MVRCPVCGSEVPEKSPSCPTCGYVFGVRPSSKVAPQTALIKVKVLSSPDSNVVGRVFEFRSSTVKVGRAPSNHVVISDPYVSRRHLELKVDGGKLYVRDLGSSNGTYLVRGGELVEVSGEPLELPRKATLRVGLYSYVEVEYSVEKAASPGEKGEVVLVDASNLCRSVESPDISILVKAVEKLRSMGFEEVFIVYDSNLPAILYPDSSNPHREFTAHLKEALRGVKILSAPAGVTADSEIVRLARDLASRGVKPLIFSNDKFEDYWEEMPSLRSEEYFLRFAVKEGELVILRGGEGLV